MTKHGIVSARSVLTIRWGRSGFTIVELIVVAAVIGILATIGMVSYGGIQTRSLNTAKYTELEAWRAQFDRYFSLNGNYPVMPDGGYCLGAGFPDTSGDGIGDCRDLYWPPTRYSVNTTLNDALLTAGTLPTGPRAPVISTLGPYVQYSGTSIQIYEVIKGYAADCPSDTEYAWHDGTGNTLLCRFTIR